MINVREIMGEPEIGFFQDPGYDSIAASQRLAMTDQCFSTWFISVNGIRDRDIPVALRKEYDRAADAICKIMAMEKEIIMKGGKR